MRLMAFHGAACRALVVAATVLAMPSMASANYWPSWRGPEHNGATRENALIKSWSPEGENLVWKAGIGGRSTPVVSRNKVYMIAPVGEGVATQERIVCLHARTGEQLWEYRFNVFHTDIVENRVGWTSITADAITGNIYAHGTGGEMYCFSGDGTLIWKRSMTEEFGRISGYGGRLDTPVVEGRIVIVSFLSSGWGSHARPVHRYVAFDKETGSVEWWSAPGGKPLDTTYSTPVVATIDGVRQLIAGNADGCVYGMLVRTGEMLWKFRLSKRGINSSVVADGDRVFVGHSEENLDSTVMGRFVCIDATQRGDITETGEVWRHDGLKVGYASPALLRDRIYVVDNSANLYSLDKTTGTTVWEYKLGRVGKGSPAVTADGVIYVAEQNGVFHILRDKGQECESLSRTELKHDDGVVEIFGSPAIANKWVYFMTRYTTYCLGVAGHPAESVRIPWQFETKGKNNDIRLLRIVPAEVTLGPGRQIRFEAQEISADTRYVRSVDAEWIIEGVNGTISADGTFLADATNKFSAGRLIARANGREAVARVRVSQRIPINEDFESMELGKAPSGWVGVAGKTQIVERDGGRVLKKLAEKPSPPFMRIRGYATPPIPGGYTVQLDMLGTKKGERFRPDMGIINSRYRMVLLGGTNQLRIESWSSLPRIRQDVDFAWDTDRWYRAKCRVKLERGQAVISAKVWPRDEDEPKGWAIEVIDPYPNTEGSPGIYGYSAGTTTKSPGPEIFYDNFKVTKND